VGSHQGADRKALRPECGAKVRHLFIMHSCFFADCVEGQEEQQLWEAFFRPRIEKRLMIDALATLVGTID
jgi:hypothetical protein